MTAGEAHQAIEAAFRRERARLIAGLARVVRDIDLAEELAQDALVVALSEWPRSGVPANPGAWLMALAKRRAVDAYRRDQMRERKHLELARAQGETSDGAAEASAAALDDDLGDELLGLLFTACHPVLSPDARAALTLRVVGGLTTEEIARAFLVSEATSAQRIVRAKKTIARAGLGFEVPRGAERVARLPSVLEVVYLIFNEGHAATAGEDLVRPDLCREALRLGRTLAGLMPEDTEVLGLLALMALQASRLGARSGPDGAVVPVTEQDRTRWDRSLIRRGLAALARAEALGGDGRSTARCRPVERARSDSRGRGERPRCRRRGSSARPTAKGFPPPRAQVRLSRCLSSQREPGRDGELRPRPSALDLDPLPQPLEGLAQLDDTGFEPAFSVSSLGARGSSLQAAEALLRFVELARRLGAGLLRGRQQLLAQRLLRGLRWHLHLLRLLVQRRQPGLRLRLLSGGRLGEAVPARVRGLGRAATLHPTRPSFSPGCGSWGGPRGRPSFVDASPQPRSLVARRARLASVGPCLGRRPSCAARRARIREQDHACQPDLGGRRARPGR